MYIKVFGATIRKLREEKGLLLRHVAAELDIDTALLSKVERGERNLKKEQVIRVAKILDQPIEDLIVLWLTDRISDLIEDEDYAIAALTMAINKLKKQKKAE